MVKAAGNTQRRGFRHCIIPPFPPPPSLPLSARYSYPVRLCASVLLECAAGFLMQDRARRATSSRMTKAKRDYTHMQGGTVPPRRNDVRMMPGIILLVSLPRANPPLPATP